MAKRIAYGASRTGYNVRIIDGNEIVKEYIAGNCRQCSQTHLHPDDSEAVQRDQLLKWAEQTAKEMAQDNGINEDTIYHDTDIDRELEEELAPDDEPRPWPEPFPLEEPNEQFGL